LADDLHELGADCGLPPVCAGCGMNAADLSLSGIELLLREAVEPRKQRVGNRRLRETTIRRKTQRDHQAKHRTNHKLESIH
jgi:hypothetical protein